MTSQILNNIKSYITEQKSQFTDNYECTSSDYYGDCIDELSNYITGSEIDYLLIDDKELYGIYK